MADWFLETGIYLLCVAGVPLIGLRLVCWGLWGDRSKGRPRSSKCWYDVGGRLRTTGSHANVLAALVYQFVSIALAILGLRGRTLDSRCRIDRRCVVYTLLNNRVPGGLPGHIRGAQAAGWCWSMRL